MTKEKIARITNILRRASARWPARWNCKSKAKIARNQYVCKKCSGIFGNSEVQVDHILPINKFVDWNQYVERLFVDEDGLQLLCLTCHKEKSALEQTERYKKVDNSSE